METNWRSGHKVFRTEEEARQYAKDIQAAGGLIGLSKTTEKATHEYIFGNFCRTRELGKEREYEDKEEVRPEGADGT